MKNTLKATALLAVASFALAACGAAPTAESGQASGSAAAKTSDMKACMVSDEGGFDDQSFNQSGKEGLDRAGKELGVEVKAAESKSDGDYQTNTDAMIQDGCNLIIGVGYKLATVLTTAAKANPDIKFALVDSTFTDNSGNTVTLDNARPLIFNTAEAAFLAGYLAAGMTSTGKVGTYGGMEIPTVQIFMEGFAKGVDKYNADNGTAVQVLGWDDKAHTGSFVGDFSSVDKGQALSDQLISQGADIIMPVAGPVGAGTLAAINASANPSSVKTIWVDADGHLSNGDKSIMTSVVKQIGNSVYDTVKAVKDGTFNSSPYIGTLSNDGVSLAPFYDYDSQIPEALKTKLDEIKKQIVDGTLDVSTQYDPS